MVLCVQAEPTLLTTRKLVLQSAGFTVVAAQTAQEALRIFCTRDIRAVVLDYGTAAMDGNGLAVLMKRLKPQVPILLLAAPTVFSGRAMSVDTVLGRGEGPRKLVETLHALVKSTGR